jgi:spore coat protein A
MDITRRSVLGAGVAAGAGLLMPLQLTERATAVVPAGVTPFTEALPTLAEMGVIDATSRGTATIEMVNATHHFHSALPATPTYAYRGGNVAQNYLGPVIVAQQGVPFEVTMVNNLGAHPLASAIDYDLDGVVAADATAPRVSAHLHGGNTDPGNDGDPTDTFVPGDGPRTYYYGNTQEAAGLWYHDHAVGITRLNVLAGLAGGYLIRNADDPGDGTLRADGSGLPPAPDYEVPLIVQDRMFNTDGTLAYPPNANPGTAGHPWAPEFFGDVATVNGKAWPNLNVARGKYRFRVYNGSNARVYNFKLRSAGPASIFFQIGSDGGLLNAPVPMTSLLPAQLRATPIMPLTTVDRPVTAIRSMTLVENLNALGSPLMALINNREFDAAGATTTVLTNALEQWDLINTTVDAHPIHLHFTQFQVLNRQKFDSAGYFAAAYGTQPLEHGTGAFPPLSVAPFLRGGTQAPPANEQGWKDTVLVLPGEVTRIIVPFGANAGGSVTAFQASHTGPYVWHCHILEHEDNDMMQRFAIV